MKDAPTIKGYAPPPHPNQETHRKVMDRLAGMSSEEIFQLAVDAGIYSPNGDLTEAYGGTAPDPLPGDKPLNQAG